ncbi:BolA/IbaG family iron-sulfur metabolism protein [Parahaliea sp. F7430]|uniref:DNA-binding transcriptional regulator BolA n=1 Tax=Sediminihaliea albiluteola TaxID=2758564 RepID=A0A7W2YIZ8_9GAMM|nr:BolA/IbaG family iron-sulfur metabolism protein [Sediminihaliea albiluteola]MBA6412582.1 BolA/IbaG family iron-sulfur metabolism protein [Sediminihaliea albiluteola]
MLVQQEIETQLQQSLEPLFLEVTNESHMHSVPPNSETHFRVVAVAEQFEGQRKVARHQRIYHLLASQLEGPVHALALHLYTPAEWQSREASARPSPDCMGGSQADKENN